jgi:transposase
MPTSTLSGEAEWPQVAGAVIEALFFFREHFFVHSYLLRGASTIRIVLSTPAQAQGEQTRRTRPHLAARGPSVLRKAQGWSVPQMARRLDRHAPTIRTWLTAYGPAGLPGLANTPPPGRPATMGQRVSAQVEPLFAHSPTHFGARAEGWTVARMRDYRAQHQGAARAATVRRQLQAGDGVYIRCANTVSRHAPTRIWRKPVEPTVAIKRHGR